jgi:hypothetical protein
MRSTSLKGDEDDDDTAAGETPGNSSHDNDADFDNDYKKESKGYRDSDDSSVVAYGHATNPADWRAIAALVKRYYAAAAADDGATGCSLIYSTFAKAVPEDYGQGAGPAYSRGTTCPVVMSKTFEHFHSQLAGPVIVTSVRVSGLEGRALLGSHTMVARYIRVKREHGTWKINQLIGESLP